MAKKHRVLCIRDCAIDHRDCGVDHFRAPLLKQTNGLFDAGREALLKADQQYRAGADVCLLLGANLLNGRVGGDVLPDHWVVLTSPVRIDGSPASLRRV